MKEPELFKHKPEDHFLQESEELENYFSNCLDLFCIADTDGYFRKLNKEWENDLGYPVEVLEGRKFLDFVHPDDRTSTLEAVSDLSKGMKIDSFTNRFRAIDGSYRIIEWRSFLSGNKIYASARDVTQREEVEKELRHSEKRYRSLFNNMLEGYALCRMIYVNGEPDDFVYIDVNPKFGQLTGLTNVAGKKVSEVIPGIKESNPELLKIYGKVALTGVPAKFEAFVGPLGIWFSVSVFSPEMDYFVAVFENISERKKTDEALKHSENKYRSIFENAIEGIFQSTLDGRYISANPALARILGDESPEELMKRVTDFEHQFYVDPDRRKQFVKEIEEHEKISDFESQVYNKKGNIIWISENARSVKNSDGNLIGYEGTTIDITERKESEEALRSSQQILEGIINAIPVRVFWKDKDLNYLGCNSSFANDAGFAEPKDIIGKDDYQMGWRDQADLYRSDDLQVIESGFAKTNIEEPQTTPDGNTIMLLTSKIPLRNSKGEINGVLGTYFDITERKKVEEDLRTNEALLSSAVKIAHLGHWENDVLNDIFTFNDHFYSMLHTTAEKEGGYKMSSAEYAKRFVHPDDIQMVVDEIMKSIETNDPKFSGKLEHRIKYSDGGAGYISVRYFITKDSSGKTIRVNGVNQDITDRKKYEQELLAAKEHAERSDKLKDAFIANISHEIRTPLNGILGMTALIRNSLSKYAGKEEKDYFSAIENASSRIIRTVDMILNFSRLQVGDFEVRPVQIRMADLTEKIITSHRPKAEAKSIKLSAENLAGDLAVTLDEYCISQAISNLVDNALKYTLQGKIELKLYTKNSNELMLDISDTGIGISGDYLERMFEPYSQEEIGYNRGYEGVGLGLSLVKKYLDLNKCKISVTSTKEVGTVFTINLGKFEKINKSKASIVTNSPVKHVRLNNHAAGLNNKPKILIVEDDRINQFYIISMLKKDYHTESAYNAESALELISKNSFDLVLMDISLKGKMNGLELTRHMRNSDTHKHTPVIAVTGHASAEDKQNCFDAGCNEFIAKPFYENEVLKKIRMFIE